MFILNFVRVYRTLMGGRRWEFNYAPYCRHMGFYRMDFVVMDGGLASEYLSYMKNHVVPLGK